MFLSVLSVKFTERVTFGMVNPDLRVNHVPLSLLKMDAKLPQYVILTPEMRYMFGSGAGEYLNYNSLALLLKTMHPEVNDVFLVSLVLVNVSCWLELSIVHGMVLKRVGHLLWHVGKWNFLLILLWLPALAVLQLPYMACVLDSALTVLRLLGTTRPVAWVRADWLCYANNLPFIVAAFIVYALGVAIVHYKYQDATPPPPPPVHFWTFPWDSYTSYLFRPMSSLSSTPPASHDYELEFGMEMLIARLAVPNFWLRPTISSDYMGELPVWKYAGPSIESGSDTDALSLEDGDGSGTECMPGQPGLPPPPTAVFTCEKCRALQENAGKSTQQLEEERLESESACAKFLMDGDYKCSCQPHHRPTR
jgi:E3 ubiquitin-protein ligase RNF103